MGVTSGIATFFVIWWTMLFITLPLGVQRNDGTVRGADPGAPQHPNMGKKLLLTTLLAAIVWLIVFGLIESDLISFREIANRMEL